MLLMASVLALSSSQVAAQTCTLYEALTYATYVDAGGTTRRLLLDLRTPAAVSAPTPVVIWVHGGGWEGGTRTPIPSRAANMCAQGYAVASVDYRLTNVARWPAQIHDVKAAVRWLRSRAGTYNLDPARFAAWGSSAGAHLAAMLGTSGDVTTGTVGSAAVSIEGNVGGNLAYSSRVQAVVAWYGLYDFLQMRFYPLGRDAEAATSYEGKLIGAPVQQQPERAATANPITFVSSDDPPFLAMHGSADDVTPFNQSELLVDALTDAGVQARLYSVIGAGHSASYFDTAAHLQAVYDFIEEALENPDEPASPPATPAPVAGGVRVEALDGTAAEGGNPGQLRISRGPPLTSSLTVSYALTGSATHGSDYGLIPRTLTIPAGSSSALLTITPMDDDLRERSEVVVVTLSPSSTYALDLPRTASVAIHDDDNDPGRPTVSVSATDRAASEAGADTGRFMLTRTGSTTSPLTVRVSLSGTATNGVDVASIPATVTFPIGVRRVTLTVTPRADSLTEGPEHLTLTPAAEPHIYVGPYARAQVTIADHVPVPSSLPPGWTDQDIGAVGVSGSASASGGMFTVTGAGTDVWGTSDAFHFAWQPLTGDGTIVARVASIEGVQAWTKMGVMIRASTSAGAAHAFMLVSIGKGLAYQRRTTTGGMSTSTAGGAGTAPRWVRLTRKGAMIAAYVSTNGTSWTLVGSDTFTMPATILAGLAAHSHDPGRAATAVFDNVLLSAAAPSEPSLPDGWTSRDIGAVGPAGSASESSGSFTIRGAGADVWHTADAFHFTSQHVTGDVTIIARVASLSGVQAWTQVGVMVRETLEPNSAHAFMIVSTGKGLAFQRRPEGGGITTHTTGGAGTAPRWVRLVRRGPAITASTSADGVAWTVVGTDMFAMASEIHVGLAVSSHDPTQLATATFDRVAVTTP